MAGDNPLVIRWDPAKAETNAEKHGVTFEDAQWVFSDPLEMTVPDDPQARGEERFISMGEDRAGKLLLVVYAERGSTIRLISARPANRRERRAYEENRAKSR